MLFLGHSAMIGQNIGCDDIKLRFGEAESISCFDYRVPVWFEYVGTGTTPDHFSFCYEYQNSEATNIAILGELVNADLIDIEIVRNLDKFGYFNLNGFTILSNANTTTSELVDIDFGTQSAPNFYLNVIADPGESFSFANTYFGGSIFVSSDCANGTYDCQPDISFFNNNDFTTTDLFLTNCNSPLLLQEDLELFVDISEANYDMANNSARIPVKLKSLNPNFGSGSVFLYNMSFELEWSNDLHQNVNILPDVDFSRRQRSEIFANTGSFK